MPTLTRGPHLAAPAGAGRGGPRTQNCAPQVTLHARADLEFACTDGEDPAATAFEVLLGVIIPWRSTNAINELLPNTEEAHRTPRPSRLSARDLQS